MHGMQECDPDGKGSGGNRSNYNNVQPAHNGLLSQKTRF
jgi:hypothetical protein